VNLYARRIAADIAKLIESLRRPAPLLIEQTEIRDHAARGDDAGNGPPQPGSGRPLLMKPVPHRLSLERSRLRRKQQRGARVHKRGTRVRFTWEGHKVLGELLPTLPRFDFRKRDGLCLGVR
jgi:hypothetical protein